MDTVTAISNIDIADTNEFNIILSSLANDKSNFYSSNELTQEITRHCEALGGDICKLD